MGANFINSITNPIIASLMLTMRVRMVSERPPIVVNNPANAMLKTINGRSSPSTMDFNRLLVNNISTIL